MATQRLPALRLPASSERRSVTVNDVHSRLNATQVARVETPRTTEEIVDVLDRARRQGLAVSVAGGRHAMGGQQFRTGGVLLDLRGLSRVLGVERTRGLAVVEAGAQWPGVIDGLALAQAGEDQPWAIVQKQTGADRLTLGGAVAANIHGRCLGRPPFVSDIEDLTLVDANLQVRRCSRTENARLFSLVVGGYGLFGIVTSVTLRLARRRRLKRVVELLHVEDLPAAFEQRRRSGFAYGDFQFAVDAASPAFLREGVFSCYGDADPGATVTERGAELEAGDWAELATLAHVDPSRAFRKYAAHYLATSGQVYWSDTHQLATYLGDYHAGVDARLGHEGSEVITELTVPRERLVPLLLSIRATLRRCGAELIYGTVRLTERDDDTALAWARWPAACVVLNIHVRHSASGRARAKAAFRALIDDALALGGNYYLTYHRHATRAQAEAAHPALRSVLLAKRELDPACLLDSDWHRHHVALLGMAG